MPPVSGAMVIRADARAMGAVTALGAPMRRKPTTRTIALTDCISYNPRNGETVDDGEVFKPIRKRGPRKYVRSTSNAAKRDAARELLMSLPTIHEGGTA